MVGERKRVLAVREGEWSIEDQRKFFHRWNMHSGAEVRFLGVEDARSLPRGGDGVVGVWFDDGISEHRFTQKEVEPWHARAVREARLLAGIAVLVAGTVAVWVLVLTQVEWPWRLW